VCSSDLFNTFGNSAVMYATWMVGLLGWLSVNVSQLAVFAVLGLVILFVGGMDGEAPVAARHRAVLLLTWLLTMLAVCLTVYGALTPVAAPTSVGIQGRYFTPCLPLLFLGVYRLRFRRQGVVVLILLAVLFLVAIATMRAIWLHYY
jgi:uncharacterized membrane protein